MLVEPDSGRCRASSQRAARSVQTRSEQVKHNRDLMILLLARLPLFGVEFADFRALVDSKFLIG
jgi:hypothetical protein